MNGVVQAARRTHKMSRNEKGFYRFGRSQRLFSTAGCQTGDLWSTITIGRGVKTTRRKKLQLNYVDW